MTITYAEIQQGLFSKQTTLFYKINQFEANYRMSEAVQVLTIQKFQITHLGKIFEN